MILWHMLYKPTKNLKGQVYKINAGKNVFQYKSDVFTSETLL